MVDVEAKGPCPGIGNMTMFGAVTVAKNPQKFYGKTVLSEPERTVDPEIKEENWEESVNSNPLVVMRRFEDWVSRHGGFRPMFVSDNNGYDWQWINYYFHYHLGRNPFGHSSTNLGSLYKGLVNNVRKNFKHLRKTKHTHHPVMDAMGNVEAMVSLNLGGVS